MLATACATLVPKPLPPSVVLESVRVVRFTPLDTRMAITLLVHNPNGYDLAVSNIEATFSVANNALLTGSLTAPANLVALADTRVEIETRTDFIAIASTIDRLTRQTDIRYELNGSATVQDGLRLPFTRRGELPAANWQQLWR